jgi:hypothetical protein
MGTIRQLRRSLRTGERGAREASQGGAESGFGLATLRWIGLGIALQLLLFPTVSHTSTVSTAAGVGLGALVGLGLESLYRACTPRLRIAFAAVLVLATALILGRALQEGFEQLDELEASAPAAQPPAASPAAR